MTREEIRQEAFKMLNIANELNEPICNVIDDIYGFLDITERCKLLEEIIIILAGFCTVGWYEMSKNLQE